MSLTKYSTIWASQFWVGVRGISSGAATALLPVQSAFRVHERRERGRSVRSALSSGGRGIRVRHPELDLRPKNFHLVMCMGALKAVFFCTLFIVWTVVSAHADSVRQDWMPSVLDLPADAEVLTDREIGPTIRMFSISTAEGVDELLSRWRESLHAEGYVMF